MTAAQAYVTTYPSRIRTCNTAFLTVIPQSNYNHDDQINSTTLSLRSNSIPSRSWNTRAAAAAAASQFSESEENGNIGSPKSTTEIEADFNQRVDTRGFVDAPPSANLIKPKFAHNTRQWVASDEQLAEAASIDEVLIPIRLDLEIENFRLKDVFVWNMNEALITPDFFAQILCADLDISPSIYAAQISSAIRTQIEEYAPVAETVLPSDQDLRVCVNLQIIFWRHLITDQFEWNLTSQLSPEEFARQMCADLGLCGEIIPTIAHAIREDLLKSKKDFCEGSLSLDIQNDMPEGLEAGIRVDPENLCALWEPRIELLRRDEMDRREIDREREIRRLRRDASKFSGYADRTKQLNDYDSNNNVYLSSAASAQWLSESARIQWRCSWCFVLGTGTWAVRSGPQGPKTLCNICGTCYAKADKLPAWRQKMYLQ